MLALFKILVVDVENATAEEKLLKRFIYDLIYMDKGALSANDVNYPGWACKTLSGIFEPYKFYLQQYSTNHSDTQAAIGAEAELTACSDVKLLGLRWDRERDLIFTDPVRLYFHADSKRKILSSIAANYDKFQFNGSLLNRARLFVDKLQCDSSNGWDDKLSSLLLKEWQNISKQANKSLPIPIQRFVGQREVHTNA